MRELAIEGTGNPYSAAGTLRLAPDAAEEKRVLLQDACGTSVFLFAEHFEQESGWTRAREALGVCEAFDMREALHVRANGDGESKVERQSDSDPSAGAG